MKKLLLLVLLLIPSLYAQDHSIATRLFPPGTSLTLKATASGTEPFTYVWSKDGATPASNSAWRQKELNLLKLTNKEEGVYAVTVKNSAGEAVAFLRIRIGIEPPTNVEISTTPEGRPQ